MSRQTHLLPAHQLAHALPNPTSTQDTQRQPPLAPGLLCAAHTSPLLCSALRPPAPCSELCRRRPDLAPELAPASSSLAPLASSSPTRSLLLLLATASDLKLLKLDPKPSPPD
jgi:hypothetical protein